MNSKKTVVVVGAGPAGLTAAYELASQSTDYQIIVIEADRQVGGISKTVDYKGNKIDIGGHRFFSKSDRVLSWWQHFLPVNTPHASITFQQQTHDLHVNNQALDGEPQMLLRPRKSRIYYNSAFFDYPLRLGIGTFWKLGLLNSFKIVVSILYRRIKPIRNEKSLEDFYINRFGDKLYNTFFKAYTEKVWGKPCTDISADWGRQRVKALGIRAIIKHYLVSTFLPNKLIFASKNTERSLSEYFLYPEQGPGQLWEKVAEECRSKGIDIRCQQAVEKVYTGDDGQIKQVAVSNIQTGEHYQLECDILISSMAIRDLSIAFEEQLPPEVKNNAEQLEYRDFLVVGLLIDASSPQATNDIDDNWLYIQDESVKVGRLQFFHNWSPHMVADDNHQWLGAEYFCLQGDELWNMSDKELIDLATLELDKLGLIKPSQMIDGVVVKMPKAYPSYVGSYEKFDTVRAYFDEIPNLFLIGRNGMHKYNNQDHSMLTAMEAVDNILKGKVSKSNIWDVISEHEYIES